MLAFGADGREHIAPFLVQAELTVERLIRRKPDRRHFRKIALGTASRVHFDHVGSQHWNAEKRKSLTAGATGTIRVPRVEPSPVLSQVSIVVMAAHQRQALAIETPIGLARRLSG